MTWTQYGSFGALGASSDQNSVKNVKLVRMGNAQEALIVQAAVAKSTKPQTPVKKPYTMNPMLDGQSDQDDSIENEPARAGESSIGSSEDLPIPSIASIKTIHVPEPQPEPEHDATPAAAAASESRSSKKANAAKAKLKGGGKVQIANPMEEEDDVVVPVPSLQLAAGGSVDVLGASTFTVSQLFMNKIALVLKIVVGTMGVQLFDGATLGQRPVASHLYSEFDGGWEYEELSDGIRHSLKKKLKSAPSTEGVVRLFLRDMTKHQRRAARANGQYDKGNSTLFVFYVSAADGESMIKLMDDIKDASDTVAAEDEVNTEEQMATLVVAMFQIFLVDSMDSARVAAAEELEFANPEDGQVLKCRHPFDVATEDDVKDEEVERSNGATTVAKVDSVVRVVSDDAIDSDDSSDMGTD